MGKKYLIDSNVLIEFTGNLLPPSISILVADIIDSDFNVSFINKIEVLGHHSVNKAWITFIDQATIIMVDNDIIEQTTQLRKTHRIKIPDAIVAATAMVNNLTLLTRNTQDFKNIQGLIFENPWDWNKTL